MKTEQVVIRKGADCYEFPHLLSPASWILILWRDARVVEWDGLENRCMGNCTEGSNPSLSAQTIFQPRHDSQGFFKDLKTLLFATASI